MAQAEANVGLGKVAVVVGVGPGAGAGIAKKFAAEQYKVALVSRRLEPLQAIENEIKQAGGTALPVTADTGREADVKAAFQAIVSEFGAYPEVLVYNAGPGNFVWPPPPLLEIPVDSFSRSFDAGVTGALAWIQQVAPAQIKAGKGTILLTGATASLRGSAKFAMLACSKFALRALAQSAARELQPEGVHVAHVIIDGLISSVGQPAEAKLAAEAIGEEYWKLHKQHRSTWSHEIDLRPFNEKF